MAFHPLNGIRQRDAATTANTRILRSTPRTSRSFSTTSERNVLSSPNRTVRPQSRNHAMSAFDYNSEAELFPTRNRTFRRLPLGYRPFALASQALRFAIEERPPRLPLGA